MWKKKKKTLSYGFMFSMRCVLSENIFQLCELLDPENNPNPEVLLHQNHQNVNVRKLRKYNKGRTYYWLEGRVAGGCVSRPPWLQLFKILSHVLRVRLQAGDHFLNRLALEADLIHSPEQGEPRTQGIRNHCI